MNKQVLIHYINYIMSRGTFLINTFHFTINTYSLNTFHYFLLRAVNTSF